MRDEVVNNYFGKDHANAYDQRWARTAPIRDTLHLLASSSFIDLPANARILCVGAGTGSELIAFAQQFPDWTFTAVEPSKPMLDVCEKKVKEAGLEQRCRLHHGFLDSLKDEGYDAATSLLVSHFITDRQERVQYFREVSNRLKPNGLLFSADLCTPVSTDDPKFKELFTVWSRTNGQIAKPESFGWNKDLAVLDPNEVSKMIHEGGFKSTTLMFQTLFIHAWLAKKL